VIQALGYLSLGGSKESYPYFLQYHYLRASSQLSCQLRPASLRRRRRLFRRHPKASATCHSWSTRRTPIECDERSMTLTTSPLGCATPPSDGGSRRDAGATTKTGCISHRQSESESPPKKRYFQTIFSHPYQYRTALSTLPESVNELTYWVLICSSHLKLIDFLPFHQSLT
jgi:hypothetical protein